jgi:hypothetical protein
LHYRLPLLHSSEEFDANSNRILSPLHVSGEIPEQSISLPKRTILNVGFVQEDPNPPLKASKIIILLTAVVDNEYNQEQSDLPRYTIVSSLVCYHCNTVGA